MATPKKPEQAIVPRGIGANKKLSYDVENDFMQAFYPEFYDINDDNEIDTKLSEETHGGRTKINFEMSFPELTSEEERALLDEIRNVQYKARSIVLDGLPDNYDGDKSPLGMDMNEPLPVDLKHNTILRF